MMAAITHKMRERIKKRIAVLTLILPAIIYITWLAAYYWLLEAGRYKAFIQPKLWPLLILALILLLSYIAAFISHFSGESGGVLKFEGWLQAAILFVPVVFLWTIYGQSLGSHALAKRALDTNQPFPMAGISPQRSSPATDDNTSSLLKLMINAEHFNGKRVAAEGMVYRGEPSDRRRFRLFRFVVVCCAADALPLVIWVKNKVEEKFNNDDWVRVEGIFSFETINGRQVSSIAADSVRPIPAPPPGKRYLFF
jgi:putative membrane protein